MFERRSLKLPITLAVTMIVLLIVLIVGWILLAVFGAMRESQNAVAYWTVLTLGSAMFLLVLVGVITYLVLTIKAISLNRRQSNFVDSVTHELKSPIASLKLCLQTLDRHQLSPEERASFLSYMTEDVERLDELISHLLAAGQIGGQRSAHNDERLDLGVFIRETARTVLQRHSLPDDAVAFSLAPCSIIGNRIEMEMIVRNLLDNAVKYGGNPLRILVGLWIDRFICIQVDDNGSGIPRGERNKVFGRFVRLGTELERRQKGTGLGLYIVRTLIERMGGDIVVGESPMKGARFTVRLPLAMLDPDFQQNGGQHDGMNRSAGPADRGSGKEDQLGSGLSNVPAPEIP